MKQRNDYYLDDTTPWGFGSAHSVSSDESKPDPVAELHKVVEEVTGKPVERPARKIGFF